MIRGRVERNWEGGLEAWISIPVRGPDGEFRQHDVILDTGFTGCLMLPEDDVRDLGLISSGSRQGIMAGGVGAPEHVANLVPTGAEATIIGRALYTEDITIGEAVAAAR